MSDDDDDDEISSQEVLEVASPAKNRSKNRQRSNDNDKLKEDSNFVKPH